MDHFCDFGETALGGGYTAASGCVDVENGIIWVFVVENGSWGDGYVLVLGFCESGRLIII